MLVNYFFQKIFFFNVDVDLRFYKG